MAGSDVFPTELVFSDMLVVGVVVLVPPVLFHESNGADLHDPVMTCQFFLEIA